MRGTIFVVAVVTTASLACAACGDSAHFGAEITLDGVASTTTRVDIVLTTETGVSGPQRIDEVGAMPTTLPADYYTQVAFGGSFTGDILAAHSGSPIVLIEPMPGVDTSAVVPFAIGYDDTGMPTEIGDVQLEWPRKAIEDRAQRAVRVRRRHRQHDDPDGRLRLRGEPGGARDVWQRQRGVGERARVATGGRRRHDDVARSDSRDVRAARRRQ